ncbi:MAG: DUF479 domain-containing protein [Symploca sp. SIO2B6]|nr:DUF479 domain-containing protein [Symploca sp. SIO2B6]
MNWLAHLLLSKQAINYQIGNLLADPLKGKVWPGCHPLIQEGFKMHGRIDAFTDSNALVQRSKSRLGKRGYLKGVVIDILYDHFLAKHWERYASVDISTFINRFHAEAEKKMLNCPQKAQEFLTRLIRSDLLFSYITLDGIHLALGRMDRRLSKRILAKETATGYWSALNEQQYEIEQDFLLFFPQLVSHFKLHARVTAKDHWLK